VRFFYLNIHEAWGLISYITLGLSFGLLQSPFRTRHPYIVAFVGAALVPIMAHFVGEGEDLLRILGLIGADYLPHVSYPIPIADLPASARLEHIAWRCACGAPFFAFILAFIAGPFAAMSVCGRFLGDELVPLLVGRIVARKVSLRREGRAILLVPRVSEEPKPVTIAKMTAYATVIAAAISAVVSILTAFAE